MVSKAFNDLKSGLSLYHVWIFQAYHEISAKYKRTALGSLWIAGQMVFMSLALSIAFGALWGQNLGDVVPTIMGGLLAFYMVQYPITDAPEVFMHNAGIISNHAYPFTYYTLEAVTKSFLTFLHNAVVFFIVLVLVQHIAVPDWTIFIGLPVLLFNMFTWGHLSSMLTARYRDLRFLLPYTGQLILFLTPIMYKPDQLKSTRHLIVDLNPFYPFVEMIRAPLLGSPMPTQYWPMALGVTVVGAILWVIFFSLFRKRIAFWV